MLIIGEVYTATRLAFLAGEDLGKLNVPYFVCSICAVGRNTRLRREDGSNELRLLIQVIHVIASAENAGGHVVASFAREHWPAVWVLWQSPLNINAAASQPRSIVDLRGRVPFSSVVSLLSLCAWHSLVRDHDVDFDTGEVFTISPVGEQPGRTSAGGN